MDEQGFLDKLTEVIRFGLKHPNYDRTVEIAKWARSIVTAEDQEGMITELRERESAEQKAQRIKITKTLTRYAAGQIISYFRKARRVDGITKEIDHRDKNTKEQIETMLSSFFAGKGLEEYLFDCFEYFTFLDPNAFIVTERRDNRDEIGEIAETAVYPFEVFSHQAIFYEYDNGLLQYLIVELKRMEKSINPASPTETAKLVETEVSDFLLYAPGLTVKLSEYAKERPELTPGQEYFDIEMPNKKTRSFVREIHHPGSVDLPAFQMGVYRDMTSDGIVYVTPLEPAKELFESLINIGSELDINRALHAFQQKIVAVPECTHEEETESGLIACNNGYLGDSGAICPVCKGTGAETHRSGQDVITIILTREMLQDNIVPPIEKLVHYVQQDPFAPTFLSESLNTTLQRIPLAVFNTEIQLIPQFAATATKEKIELEKIYDTVRPYTKGISRGFIHSATITAQYIEKQDGFTVEHAFPPDLGMKSLDELVEDYQNALNAGLPKDILNSIMFDILKKQHPNNPDKVEAIKARHKFRPWRDKSTEEVVLIASSRPRNDRDRVLYENFAAIFDQIEAETAGELAFHLRPYDKQKEVVDAKVQQFIEGIGIAPEPQRIGDFEEQTPTR